MTFQNVSDLDGLFSAISKCKGRVELVGDDIRLNLKSKLAQVVSLANIFSAGHDVPKLEIWCENPDDTVSLIKYMING